MTCGLWSDLAISKEAQLQLGMQEGIDPQVTTYDSLTHSALAEGKNVLSVICKLFNF